MSNGYETDIQRRSRQIAEIIEIAELVDPCFITMRQQLESMSCMQVGLAYQLVKRVELRVPHKMAKASVRERKVKVGR